MKKVILGKLEEGGNFTFDVPRFMDTRELVMASSGGGKSWALRKKIEEIYGQCQIVIIDIEGEFGTLREKFDFVVAGKGGDVTADPRYAEPLARKLLELRTDAICDLYELKQHERIRFVRLFFEAMINAPKELWHPVAVILDEAHIFAPEKGSAESLGAVIDMASRGRKRGFSLIAATQRLSKLHKDVAAECQNKLIGLANMDIDRKRAAEELGFTEKAAVLALRDMEPGQFYAVGPAFGRGVHKVQIGPVKTHHPKSGAARRKVHTPAPTARVKAVLAKLADLPKEAEQQAQDTAGLKARIRQLEQDARAVKHALPVVKAARDPKEIQAAYDRGHNAGCFNQRRQLSKAIKAFTLEMDKASKKLKEMGLDEPQFETRPVVQAPKVAPIIRASVPPREPKGDQSFGLCERRILGFLASKPDSFFSKAQVGAMSGYAHTSGGFNNSLGKLTSAGMIRRQGGQIALEPSADVSELVDGVAHRLEDWIAKLGKCERSIYEKVLASPGVQFTKEEIGEATGYASTSGGFNNSLGRLNTLALIVRQGGTICLNPEIEGLR